MNKFWNFTDNDDGSRTLMLCGSIADESWYDDDITPKAFREELNAGKGDVVIWINSPGGDCVAAAQIYNSYTFCCIPPGTAVWSRFGALHMESDPLIELGYTFDFRHLLWCDFQKCSPVFLLDF